MSRTSKPRKRVKGVTKDSEAAQRAFLDAGIELFARQGYKATSTESIAELAGYSQAAMFFHFGTKQGLLRACLEKLSEEVITTPLDDYAADTLQALLKIDSQFSDDHIAAFFARVMSELVDNEAVLPTYAAVHLKLRSILSDRLRRETGAGKQQADFAAAALLCMMVGVHAEHGVEHQEFTRADYTAMLEFVGGLVVDHLKTAPAKGSKRKSPK